MLIGCWLLGDEYERSCIRIAVCTVNILLIVEVFAMATAAAVIKRVVVTRRLPAASMALLSRPDLSVTTWDSDEPMPRRELEAAVSAGGGAHALICLLSERVDKALLDMSPGLVTVSTMSVGYSHIATDVCKERGIKIGYTPDVLTDATADLTLALTLATARRIPEAAQAVKTGEWSSWKPCWMTGKAVHGAAVGIVGMGRIGAAVARRFKGFGCSILYTGRSGPKPEYDAEFGSRYLDLPELLKTADFVVLLCASTPETRGLIGRDQLAMMKDSATIINVARGEIVDQDALIAALQSRPGLSAGLDVTTPEPLPTDSPLLALPNCVVLPHIGSATQVCREHMATITIQNAINALDDKALVYEVPL